MTEKRCTKCGEVKGLEGFSKNKTKKDGYQNHCKACYRVYRETNLDRLRERERLYRRENPEVKQRYREANSAAIRAKEKEWREKNAEAISQRKQAYRERNARVLSEQQRARYWSNPTAFRERQRNYQTKNAAMLRKKRAAHYQANAELLRQKVSIYRKTNPDYARLRNQKRRAKLKGNGGRGITVTDITLMREVQGGICTYCKRDMQDPEVGESLDHVIPIDQGGQHDPDNAVLCCPICNSSKNNRTPEQWVNRWYERE